MEYLELSSNINNNNNSNDTTRGRTAPYIWMVSVLSVFFVFFLLCEIGVPNLATRGHHCWCRLRALQQLRPEASVRINLWPAIPFILMWHGFRFICYLISFFIIFVHLLFLTLLSLCYLCYLL